MNNVEGVYFNMDIKNAARTLNDSSDALKDCTSSAGSFAPRKLMKSVPEPAAPPPAALLLLPAPKLLSSGMCPAAPPPAPAGLPPKLRLSMSVDGCVPDKDDDEALDAGPKENVDASGFWPP
jgi:hypothetical protein